MWPRSFHSRGLAHLYLLFFTTGSLCVSPFSRVNAQQPAVKIDERAVLKPYKKEPVYVAYSADGKLFASASRGLSASKYDPPGKVILWDAATRKPLRTLERGRIVTRIAFCPTAANLAVATEGKRSGVGAEVPVVEIWDAQKGAKIHTLEDAGYGLAYSPNGALLATGGGRLGNVVDLWDPRAGKKLATRDLFLV